ncbi:MAG: ATP-binding cassette domain-containing protein [Myxococcaceae bacterium]|nr:ATP-binding cassette domain-containing protein [Myxococcaceae bacterium]MCA3012207.1 ATP-binding cassette domain-containing protein [Myxococcaceae bacterium]
MTLKRLYSLAWPERGPLALAALFLIVGSSGNLAFPSAAGSLLDEALNVKTGKVDLARVDALALTLVGIFLVTALASALRFYIFSRAGERIVSRLRVALYESLMRQEVGFFDGQKTGELSSRLSSDASLLQTTVTANISMVLRNTVQALGAVTMLLLTSSKLTLTMLAVVPPVALGAVFYGRKVRKLAKESQDALAKASEVAVESLAGIRTVRSFAAERQEVARYGAAITGAQTLAFRRITLSSTFFGAASFFAFTAGAFVFWYGARMVANDELSAGKLLKFLMYTMQLAFGLSALAELWTDVQRAAGAAERVFELLHRAPAIPSSGGTTLPKVQGAIGFEHVTFAYPARRDVPVLTDFSLSLQPGEVVALVGPSGAGKSTIASLLYRLYDPDSGRLSLDHVPYASLDPEWLRRQIGVVAQEPLLFSCSIAENIRYGRPDATDAEVEAAAKLANAHGFISAFPERYATLVGERGIQLSGGQKQRVAIARAVLKDPRLLVLDEATSALDSESEHLVREALERLMKGRTTLVIAHRLSTVRDAQRVVVLEGGRVVQSGTHARLVEEDGLYRRLVERQFAA